MNVQDISIIFSSDKHRFASSHRCRDIRGSRSSPGSGWDWFGSGMVFGQSTHFAGHKMRFFFSETRGHNAAGWVLEQCSQDRDRLSSTCGGRDFFRRAHSSSSDAFVVGVESFLQRG